MNKSNYPEQTVFRFPDASGNDTFLGLLPIDNPDTPVGIDMRAQVPKSHFII